MFTNFSLNPLVLKNSAYLAPPKNQSDALWMGTTIPHIPLEPPCVGIYHLPCL